jgi:hypothetical protein
MAMTNRSSAARQIRIRANAAHALLFPLGAFVRLSHAGRVGMVEQRLPQDCEGATNIVVLWFTPRGTVRSTVPEGSLLPAHKDPE